jgi:peroxiredoxin Q/BCP
MAAALKIGDQAPDFELTGDAGAVTSLRAFGGKQLVLYFYPRDDTSGCTREAIDFSSLRPEFTKAGTEVIGISADSAQSHEQFKKKYDLALTLLSDERKAAIEAYGVWVEKSMYGKKYMGIERATFLIDRRGKIAQVWKAVKVAGHAAEVLKAAQNL